MPQRTRKEMTAESVNKAIADMNPVTNADKDSKKEGIAANGRG